MSLLRQRATEVRVESIFRARRPAAARAWLVRLTSWRSDVELKLLASQAYVGPALASSPIPEIPNARASPRAIRRMSWRLPERFGMRPRDVAAESGRVAGTEVIKCGFSCCHGVSSPGLS